MKARGWEKEEIRKRLSNNLLNRKKADDLLEELGASEEEKKEFNDIFDKMPRNASLDAEMEDGDGDNIPVMDVCIKIISSRRLPSLTQICW